MPTCSFCRRRYKEPRGLTIFTFDGRSIHYCSSKCRRNHKLKRDPRKVNWVKRDKKMNKSEKIAEKIAEKIEQIKDETGSETHLLSKK